MREPDGPEYAAPPVRTEADRESAHRGEPEAPSRRAAAVAAVVLGALLVVVVAVMTPWHPLPGGRVAADPALDFTRDQIARSKAFGAALDPPAYAGLAIGLVVALGLGLTPWGARLLGVVTRRPDPSGANPPLRLRALRLIAVAVVLSALSRLVTLPFAAWSESVLRRYGLSTQGWGSWLTDRLTELGVSLVIWIVALLALHLLIHRFPRHWWAGAAVGGFLLVTGVFYAYPVVVEPLFNSFTRMPAGPLRTDLLRMAHADGVPVRDVLVADASKRTTELNAYVSGFGSTRRIVVYDTLLASQSPKEVRLVVAHELGHAKRGDVLTGTLVSGLGVAAGACVLYLAMTSPRLLRRAGVRSAADPRSTALLLATVTVLTLAAGPVQNLMSRHVEARADVHALDLTRDPVSFGAMQRSLSLRNLDDLSPSAFAYALWNTHPSGPERIAMGRAWARLHHVPVPAPSVRP
ncbi:M48 family metallopeptidase [Actinoallomurus purpureus]|uniref:M48 family metallopeptidase n=1 Tax=Actinoallomurus purpureus TaxID=478114 RepID=UPI002092B38B|nr:M48 family metallopeptidase [Actinoallomurus purpureus]MCO6005698.1 M48 family metallopeptidase [Actinoallomurus purpureus]